ncbi:MAG: exo-alpha-sialidase, partial [Planctomycetales bacterium]|nr:exo-alpha-sialidase [Planctomycetales bacterium]
IKSLARISCLCILGSNVLTINTLAVTKLEDLVIYEDPTFYSAFPSIVARPEGELLVAFRRAPNRKVFGEKGNSHTDSNSYLVMVRSHDNGTTWSKHPALIHAHAFGGSQDPCMIQLSDQSIVCSSYAWARVADEVKQNFDEGLRHDNFVFMGGYLLRSEDGGHTWSDPILPPPVKGSVTTTALGGPCPAYNRGAMCQTTSGQLHWAVAVQRALNPRRAETHLLTSTDGGRSWGYACPIASDDSASFNETSLYETPKGDLVAFMRTADFEDHTVIARSTNSGRSFEPWVDTGWQGHPHYALRLPDLRVLLVYGYRHKPYGIRARVLNAECTDFNTAEEIVLRNDGGNSDLGYPWATMTADDKALVVYYFNKSNGTRHIAGTLLSVE